MSAAPHHTATSGEGANEASVSGAKAPFRRMLSSVWSSDYELVHLAFISFLTKVCLQTSRKKFHRFLSKTLQIQESFWHFQRDLAPSFHRGKQDGSEVETKTG